MITMPHLPLARRPRRDMQFGSGEMENFTIKWPTNLVTQDVWSCELLLEYFPPLSCGLVCSQPSQCLYGTGCSVFPERIVDRNFVESQASPTLGCRGKPLEVQNFCQVWICQGKCLGHVDSEHAISHSWNRTEESKSACFRCQDLLPDLYTPQFGVELHAEQIQPYLSNGSRCPGRFPSGRFIQCLCWRQGIAVISK